MKQLNENMQENPIVIPVEQTKEEPQLIDLKEVEVSVKKSQGLFGDLM